MDEKELQKLEEKKQREMTARHTMSHVLAGAIKSIFGDVKFGIGPAIEDGFYYDFDMEHVLNEDDFDAIDQKMREIVEQNLDMVREEISREEALKMFCDQPYKVELIKELPEEEVISVYHLGDVFTDLCRGPHVENTKVLRSFAFKINRVSGAYWRGSEKNKMLQRIYVYGFLDKQDLKEHLRLVEEAKQRDHRKLGKELGIFMFSELVGKGLPMWLPNGFILRRILNDYITDKELARGYKHVLTPALGNVELYKTSGHWEHYKEDMFPSMELDDEAYVLRPMNCPHHMMIYKNFMHSYHDLPLRIAEIASDFRYEASGTLCGIERARSFFQNDSHIFCTSEQIGDEIKSVVSLILEVYKDFGFKNYEFRLSLRDKNNTEKYFSNDELWEKSENALRKVLNELGVDYYEAEGEAAFYGPKIDVQVKSAIGHDVSLSTVQVDYQLPERFELEYVDADNQKKRPVVIHRAILGSLDRFTAFLLEEVKGVFPVWLCPVQARVMNVSENSEKYAESVYEQLKAKGYRVEKDFRNEKISYKIREAVKMKIPYMVIIGDNEMNNNTVSIRKRGNESINDISFEVLCANIDEDIKNKI